MGHVVRMTLTGAAGIAFVFAVDAANLFWLSQLDQPILMAAIGYAFAVQFFAVSIGVGLMIATTAVVSRSIGYGERALSREQGTAGMLLTVLLQILTAGVIVIFREPVPRPSALCGGIGQKAAVPLRRRGFHATATAFFLNAGSPRCPHIPHLPS